MGKKVKLEIKKPLSKHPSTRGPLARCSVCKLMVPLIRLEYKNGAFDDHDHAGRRCVGSYHLVE